MFLEDFMNENFPGLELRPALFYSWKPAIRFELGVNYHSDYAYDNSPYLQGVYHRAISLFKALHSQDDDILIIVDVNDFENGKTFKRKIKAFSHYIKEKSVLYRLKQKTMPYIFQEEDEERLYKTHRFYLKCKTSQLKSISMIKAICNQDMGIEPSIFHRVYFINTNNKTIFHIYDDRGCDLLAASTDAIMDAYETYSDWILDYDRNEIDEVFK